jgi:hypothetical protein
MAGKKRDEKRFEITLYCGALRPIEYTNCEIIEQSEGRVHFTGKRKDNGLEGFMIWSGPYLATVQA